MVPGGLGRQKRPVDLRHGLAIAVITDAVEQGRDPFRIDLEGRHLLPEPLAALPVGQQELGLGQVAGEQEHQLLLLESGEALLPGLPP